MRVVLLASYFPKPANPLIGTWALDQAKALRRAGVDLTVISLTPWIPAWPGQGRGPRAYSECPAEHTWDGVRVLYPRWCTYPMSGFERLLQRNPLPWLRLGWAFSKKRIVRQVTGLHPDLLFAHHTAINGWVAGQISARLNVPYLCQDHAIWEVADYCREFPAYHRAYRDIARKAARLLGVSPQMAEAMKAAAPEARIAVLPNGANLPPASSSLEGPRSATLFSAGMLVGWKGFDILLRAWAQVVPKFPTARLRIAGDGVERENLAHLARDLGITGSVTFLGRQEQSRVHAEMAAARGFVLTSWRETLGVVLLEAAAASTPVVWCDNGGAASLFADGVHGFSIPPRDVTAAACAMERLLADPATSAAMGSAAHDLVRRDYTWDAVARRAFAYFEESIAEHRK